MGLAPRLETALLEEKLFFKSLLTYVMFESHY
jgi:hypothetical protein